MAASMGMGRAALEPLIRAPIAEARAMLAKLHEELPARFRRAAFEVHPDRNPDDPRAAERFKLLVRVRKILEGVTIEGHVPPVYAEGGWDWMTYTGFSTESRFDETIARMRYSYGGTGVSFHYPYYTGVI